MQQEVSAIRAMLVSALVAGVVSGLATIVANLTGDTHLTVTQQLIVGLLVAAIKAVQKGISTGDGGTGSSVLLGTK